MLNIFMSLLPMIFIVKCLATERDRHTGVWNIGLTSIDVLHLTYKSSGFA